MEDYSELFNQKASLIGNQDIILLTWYVVVGGFLGALIHLKEM